MTELAERKRWHRRWLWGILVVILVGAAGSLPALSHQVVDYRIYRLPTNSMAPALVSGDRIRVEQWRGHRQPERGEIWVFNAPPQAAIGNATLVKRLVGLPGETIEVRSGVVHVNGKPLDEPYLTTPATYTMPPVALGADEFFMLGDKRNGALDSHVWGPLRRDHLIGRVEMRCWPPTRFGSL